MLTTFNEVDMKPIMDLRKRYQNQFVEKHGIKLGMMSFFLKACALALREYPNVNAKMDMIVHNIICFYCGSFRSDSQFSLENFSESFTV